MGLIIENYLDVSLNVYVKSGPSKKSDFMCQVKISLVVGNMDTSFNLVANLIENDTAAWLCRKCT